MDEAGLYFWRWRSGMRRYGGDVKHHTGGPCLTSCFWDGVISTTFMRGAAALSPQPKWRFGDRAEAQSLSLPPGCCPQLTHSQSKAAELGSCGSSRLVPHSETLSSHPIILQRPLLQWPVQFLVQETNIFRQQSLTGQFLIGISLTLKILVGL